MALIGSVIWTFALGGCSDDTKGGTDIGGRREAQVGDLKHGEGSAADGPKTGDGAKTDGPKKTDDGAKVADGTKVDGAKATDGTTTGSACVAAGGTCVVPVCGACGAGKEPSSNLYSDCPTGQYCCVPVSPATQCGQYGFCLPGTCPTGMSPGSYSCSAGRVCCQSPC